MDIKHLDYFREIVDSGFNLSKAANKLHITQPSLSMLVNSWEKHYGIKLFNKHKGRYVDLTKEGEYIYNHAKQLLTIHNNFLYSLEEIKGGFKGNVKIGIPPLIISLLFNRCILDFIKSYPEIHLTIIEEGASKLEKLLAKGDIDIAILIDPIENELFNITKLYEDELMVIINKNSTLSNIESLNIADISNENLVILSEDFILHNTIMNLYNDQSLQPKISFKTSQWDLILDIVKDTNSISILPAPVKSKIEKTDAIAKKFVPRVPWCVLLATNKTKIKTPAIKFSMQYMTSYFKTFSYEKK